MLCNIFLVAFLSESHRKASDDKWVRNLSETPLHTRHGFDEQEAWPGRTRSADRTDKKQASGAGSRRYIFGKIT